MKVMFFHFRLHQSLDCSLDSKLRYAVTPVVTGWCDVCTEQRREAVFESVNSAPPATGVVPSTASRQGKPLSFGAILGLHLFPGLGIFAFFLLGGPLIASWG